MPPKKKKKIYIYIIKKKKIIIIIKMEARNSGIMWKELGQNAGRIRAKIRAKSRGTKIKKRQKKIRANSLKKERIISCIFKSIKLFVNNSQQLASTLV